jgi:RHS repeat-associated protein
MRSQIPVFDYDSTAFGYDVGQNKAAAGTAPVVRDHRRGTAACGSVTGLDYFGARYFSGAQGRFTSPDPMLASGRAEDPQSWNRYAYGRNNPLRFIDPTGLDYYDQNGNRIGAGGDGNNYVVTDEEEIKRIRASKTTVALNSLSSTTLLPDAMVIGALNDAVARSNSPTQDDPKGGFHEEGGTGRVRRIRRPGCRACCRGSSGPQYLPAECQHCDWRPCKSCGCRTHRNTAGGIPHSSLWTNPNDDRTGPWDSLWGYGYDQYAELQSAAERGRPCQCRLSHEHCRRCEEPNSLLLQPGRCDCDLPPE